MSLELKERLSRFGRKIKRAFRGLRTAGKRLWLVVLILVGVVVVIASVAYATTLDDRMSAVSMAATGSIIGTAIVCLALPRLAQTQVEQQLSGLEESIRDEVKLEASLDKVRAAADQLLEETLILEREKDELENQIRRLENMRVNTDGLQGILRLALLDISAGIKDFYRKELSSEPPDGILRGEVQEYIGVVDVAFRASLGVDLQKVRLRAEGDNLVVISGLSSEFQGFSDLSENWLLKEVRARKWGGIRRDLYEVLPNDERVADLTIEHRRSLQRRINSGIDFRYLDSAIKRIARETIATLLQPLQKDLVFVEDDDHEGMQLFEFLESHNTNLDLLMDGLQERRSALEGKSDKLLPEGG